MDDLVTLTHTTTSTDTDYAGLALDIPVTVDDDDTPVDLVSNRGQSGNQSVTYSRDHGQAFTTGNNSNGYIFASVTVISEDPGGDAIDLKICEVAGVGAPTEACTDLTPPDSFARGPLVFTVPDGSTLTLTPGTTYMVVFKTPDTGTTVQVAATSSDSEDSTSLPGWSIRNKFQWNSPNDGWQDSTHDHAIRIIISGVVIADDEAAGVTVVPDTGLQVGEGDTATYTVVLDSQPSGAVTVTAASADAGAVTVTPTVLTFTSTNWATAQTVTVSAVDDDDADDESVTVSHGVSSTADAVYDAVTADGVTVAVADDEATVDKRLALGMPVTVSGGVSGDAFSVVDGVADTYVELAARAAWEVVVDLGDAFELSSVVVAGHVSVHLVDTYVQARLDSSDNWTQLGRTRLGHGGTVSVTNTGLFRYVRVKPPAPPIRSTRIAEVEVWGFESKRVSDFDPALSGSLSDAGFSSRLESWSFSDGALSPDSGSASVLVADLCSECDLGHEALVEATVRMLVEFPATNPHADNSSGVNLSVGLEEGAGRRRGVVARLFPWMTFDRGAKQGPLQLGMYCGGGSGGVDRLKADGVDLSCTGGVVEDVVDHTPQDVDVSLAGNEVWVELEYRNLKLWVRVWDKDGVRPVLPQAGMMFGPAHFNAISFRPDEDWVLNPARLVIRSWGWDTGMVKVKDVEVTGMVKGPRRGHGRGSNVSGLDFRGRYSPLGRVAADLPDYATDRASGLLPEVVVDGSPGYVSIYDKAWELAYTRMRKPSSSQPWYRTWMDEAFNDKLFQWDMASMMWFAKYMHQAFNVMGSMDIFYQTQRDDGAIARRFRESNGASYGTYKSEVNPPLFVWAEWQSFRLTGDLDRVRRVVPALREHIDWFSIVRWAQESVHKLYWNEMFGSGNETLPRPYGRYSDGGKVYGDPDTSAMVAQAYLLLGDLYDQLGDTAEAAAMRAIGEAITDRINRYLWKTFTVDGTTYGQWFYATYNGSIAPTSGAYVDEPQTASLWVMTLGVDDAAKREQVKRLLDSEDWYNTDVPLGTLPKSHSQYQGWGGYGLGQVMSPYTYVAIKGAETLYGYEYAQGFSEKYLDGIAEVYEYSDTIWEHYAPDKQTHTDITNALYYQGVLESHRTSGRADCTTHTAPTNAEERWGCEIVKTGYTLTAGNYAAPARRRNVAYEHEPGGVYNSIPSIVKPDFVGWGGIGPIALLIENVIGIQPDSIDKEITWHMTRTDRHGLNNLWLGGDLGKIDLIAAARTDSYSPAVITVTSANADTTTTTTATLKIIHPSYEDCTTVHVITLNQANQQFTSQPCNRGLVVLSPAELVVAEGATGTYTVALGTEPTADVTVTISGQTGTDVSLSGLTNNQLTFTTGNWDTSQTVTVTAAQDTDEVDDVVTLTHTTTSTDNDYAGLSLGIPVTVDDDDTAVVLVSNRGQSRGRNATYSSDHGQAFTTGNNSNGYTVASVTVISEDPNSVPIDLKICEVDADGAPTAVCTDLTPPDSFARGPLVFTVPDGPTFAPGTTYMVVFKTPNTGTVRVGTTSSDSEDSTSLPGWSIRNKFQWNSSNGWQDAADDNAIRIIISGVVIADDEVAGVTVVPDTGLSVGEGGTGTYTVVLDSQPSGAVTVTAASADVGAVTVTPTVLTFTSANWATAQTVTVTAEQDDDASAESVDVAHTAASSADTAYNGLAVDVVTVTVADDEATVAGGLALGMPVTVSGGVSGDAFSVVDGVGDTFVEVGGSWSVVVDLGDAFELSSVGVAPPSGGVLGGVVVSGRLGSSGVWTEFGRAGVGGGSVSVTDTGLFRYVRVVPVTALVSGVTNRVGEVVVWGFESKRVSDFDPVLSGSLSGAGFSSRLESWSFSGGALSPDSGSASVLVADLCSECDLGHEALVEATVRMLVEFPATNPHAENSSGVNLSVGLEEGAGRRRGVVARLFPWMTFDRGAKQGPLQLGMYCGGGSGGVDRLKADGVDLSCTGGVVEDVVDHTPQDVDVSLAGNEVWVELEYRNLKLWVRVWDKDGVRPVLPQAGMMFGPAHFNAISFRPDEDWVLNPARLVIRSWGWDTGMVKVKDVEVTGMVKGPRRGHGRGSNVSGLDFRGRYSPLGRVAADLPDYATDRASGLLPEVVVDGSPGYVSIYDKAWELAYTRMRKPSSSQPWYRTWMDEAFNDKLFQWDMASMMWFAKYMHQAFNVMGSMDIFYQTQRDDGAIARRFRESNGASYGTYKSEVNPPLFVWAEWQSFRLTGDLDRVRRVVPALREHIDWFSIVRWAQESVHKLYWNEMFGSGNETLPRPYGRYSDGGKVYGDPDTSAMVAQAYLLLGDLYDQLGDTAEAAAMRAIGEAITDRINRYLWKTFTVDGTTYGQWFYATYNGSIAPTSGAYVDEPQTASLWVMTLGVDDAAKREQVKRLLDSEDWYNTDVPLGTLPKSHSQYQGWGGYGLGQVMSPYTYVAIKGAETLYGYEYAQGFSEKYLDGIAEVYEYSDTIWEHYAPDKQTHTDITNALYYQGVLESHRTSGRADCTTHTAPTNAEERWGCEIVKTGYTLTAGNYAAPARRRNVAYEHEPGGVYNSIPSIVKPDFVGWGGIGPIALLIENVIGIQPDAIDKEITWHMTRTDRHGLNNLWLGGDLGKIDLIAAARTDSYSPAVITVTSANADTTTTTTATLKIIHPSYEDCTTVHVITLNQANQQFTSQPCPGVVLSPKELVVAEGATVSYMVRLATEPTADVTVTISWQAGTDVSLSGLTNNQLTFTTGNWATAQTVTVTAAQDTDAADDEVTLTHTTTSTDADYAALALGMAVTVDDDDTAGLVVSRTGLSLPVESVLVSNGGQSGDESVSYSSDHGQAFTTGNNSNGYAVGSVTIISEDLDGDAIDLQICEVDGDGAPTAACTGLTPPGSFAMGSLVFTVPDGSTFAPGTTYMVVFKTPDTGEVKVAATSSDGEDSTSLPGWSIRNKFQWNSPDGWQDAADDNAIRIIISGTVAGLVVAEGATGTYTVALATEPSADVTVTVTISGQAGTDVSLDKTSLTFTTGNWDTPQTVTVTAGRDVDNLDEMGVLTLTAAGGEYDGVTDEVAVTIDDTAGLVVSRTGLSLPEESVLVGNSGQSGDESATYNRDHGQAFTTGNNSNGYAVGSVTVISEDPDNDAIDLQICEVDGGGAPTAVCTDLTPPDSFARGSLVFTVPDGSPLTLAPGTTYMVVFKAPDTGTVRVDATSSDGEDSTSLPGWSIRNRFQWNSPTGWQDSSKDNAIRIIISGTVAGLVVAEGATGTYTVALGTEPSADVTVTVSGQAGTDVSLLGLTNNRLTFTTGNWDTSQTVTVTAAQDTDEVDDLVTLTHTTTSMDADYAGLALGIPVTVDDDDTAVDLVSNSGQGGNQSVTYSRDHGQAFTTGNNSNGYAVGSVTVISEDTDAIELQICEVAAGGAPTAACTGLTPPDSFARGSLVFTVPDGSTLTLTPGTTYMVVFKTPDTETVRVAATSSDSEDSTSLPGWSIRNKFQWNSPNDGWQDSTHDHAIRIVISGVVIADDEVAGVTVVPDTGLPVGEGGTGSYTVVLDSQPSGAVTVTASSADAGAVTVTPTVLTFTPANWAVAQTVTVSAVDDDDADDETIEVSHGVSSTADAVYDAVTADSVTVAVTDDEATVDKSLALGMPVTVTGGVSGDAFSVVDGVADTYVELAASAAWEVVVDLGDAFELSSVVVAGHVSVHLVDTYVQARLDSSDNWTQLGRTRLGHGGTVSVTNTGLFRYVRVKPPAPPIRSTRIAEVEVWGFESKRVSDFDPALSGSLSDAGFSSRLESWSFSDGALSPDSGSASVLVADLCSECDLGHEALVEATVRMLVEFPATNPHADNSSGVNLSVGLEEGAGRRRGVVARLFPWMTFDRGAKQGPLQLGMYCGGGSGGVDRLKADGVDLSCTGGVVEDVVDHTPQDVDVSLAGNEVWVELEYRNLKLWVRVWDKDGVRPVLPQAGMMFGPAHFTRDTFNTDEDWVLNPARLVIRSWGWDTGMVKVKDVEVTGMVKGPRRGLARGSNQSGLDFRGRYSPLGRVVEDLPDYATDRASGLLPEVVVDGSPEYVSIYDKAWELAYSRVRKPSSSQPWYRTWMDEAFNDRLFQWDMATMMWFAKYMHQSFNIMGSMDIYYQAQRDDGGIARRLLETNGAVYNIWNAEVNPPLFAWAEWQSFRLTGDLDRVKRVLPALREYIDWYSIVRWAQDSVHKLYWNEPGGSGNETLPRPYRKWNDGGKVWADPDTSAMVAQVYLLLGDLYDQVGDTDQAAAMRAIGEAITDRINRYMWKTFTVDGTTYGQWFYVNANGDIAPTSGAYVDEPQTASLWVMTLGVDDAAKREQIKRLLDSEDWYNTDVPLGTLPKSHSQYQGWGGYGLGQVMSPYTYVAIKGAETLYGYEYAQDFSEKYLDGIAEVYEYSDTIWEHYAPDKQTHTDITNSLMYIGVLDSHRTSGRADCETHTTPKNANQRWGCEILKTGYTLPPGTYAAPARRRHNEYDHNPDGILDVASTVKPDFVGWGGIGPIALLIENVIGIQPDAIDKEITWHMTRTDRHGLNNLWLGGDLGKIDLIAAARTDSYSPAVITVTSANADTTTTTTATLKIIHPSYEDCTTVHVITLNQANQQFTSQPCNRGLVVLSPKELVVAEGATGTYTVALGTEPTADVTVTISGQTGTDVSLSGLTNNQLTFTTGNWDTSQTVTVTAAQDTDEVDDVVTLTHTTTSTDTDYAGLSLGIPVTVDDDDTAVVLVSNRGQSRGRNATYSSDHGQAFTTGNNSNGYTVASVTVISEDPNSVPIDLKICEVDAVGAPTAVCTDLISPDSFARGPLVFTVPDGPTFAPGTTYMVVFKTPDTGTVRVGTTSSDSEDSTSLPGWSIRNKFQWNSSNGWQDAADDNAIRIIISGVVIADDEVAGVTVVPDTGLSVGEGGTGTYTVVLDSEPSGAVTVTAASADSGAVTVTPTVLTFTTGNWDTAQTVTVTAEDDNDADDESVDVSHTAASSADAAYNNLAGDVVTVTVTDNDEAGVTIVPDAGLMSPVGEGGTGSYTVVLDSQPSGEVTVTAASADSGAVTVTPTVLTFTTGNWDTAQTVTVTAEDDNDADDESVDVLHTAASSDDAAYNGLAGDVVTVTVTDNDDAGVTVVPDTGLSVGEGDTGTYTVVLDSEPSGAVTVNLVGSGDLDAVTVSPTVLTFTPGNWATAQTVTVSARGGRRRGR